MENWLELQVSKEYRKKESGKKSLTPPDISSKKPFPQHVFVLSGSLNSADLSSIINQFQEKNRRILTI